MFRYYVILSIFILVAFYKLFLIDNMALKRFVFQKINKLSISLTMEFILGIILGIAGVVLMQSDEKWLFPSIVLILICLISNISVIFIVMVLVLGLHTNVEARMVFSLVRFNYKDDAYINVSILSCILFTFFETVSLSEIFRHNFNFILIGLFLFLVYKINITKNIYIFLMSLGLILSIILCSYVVYEHSGIIGMFIYGIIVNVLMLFKE